jgi:hypothetical protein
MNFEAISESKFDDPPYIYCTGLLNLNYTDPTSEIRNSMVRPKLFCLMTSSLLRR